MVLEYIQIVIECSTLLFKIYNISFFVILEYLLSFKNIAKSFYYLNSESVKHFLNNALCNLPVFSILF